MHVCIQIAMQSKMYVRRLNPRSDEKAILSCPPSVFSPVEYCGFELEFSLWNGRQDALVDPCTR